MSSNSHTQTAAPPAESSRLRMRTRWRSASALKTRSRPCTSESESAGSASGAQHWTTGRERIATEGYRKNLLRLVSCATVPHIEISRSPYGGLSACLRRLPVAPRRCRRRVGESAAKESCCGASTVSTAGEPSSCGCAAGSTATTSSAAATADDDDPLPGELPVAVIGAGPVGLAAAAHLIERGIRPLVFEAGAAVGASIREWGHVRVFSPC